MTFRSCPCKSKREMPDVSIAKGEMVREESIAGKMVGIKTKIH